MMEVVALLTEGAAAGGNEDTVGWCGDARTGAAWVVDGATGVAGRTYVAGPADGSDAAWYARRLGRALATQPPNGDLPRTMAGAIADVAAQWAAVAEPDVPTYGLPSAAVAYVRWRGGVLSYAGLGDCSVLVRAAGGPARPLGPAGVSKAEVALNAAVRKLQDEGVSDPEARRQALMDRLRTARGRMNRPGGYWIFSIEPAAADHLNLDEVRFAAAEPDGAGGHVLLATDGFHRLVDPYGLYDPDGLVRAAADKGLEALYAELRAVEAADADCRRFPRIKPADDASAVLLRWRP